MWKNTLKKVVSSFDGIQAPNQLGYEADTDRPMSSFNCNCETEIFCQTRTHMSTVISVVISG